MWILTYIYISFDIIFWKKNSISKIEKLSGDSIYRINYNTANSSEYVHRTYCIPGSL